jgi:hypothetical protein
MKLSLTTEDLQFTQAEQQKRHEVRRRVILPLRLTTGSGDMIPAVVLNVSASGLLLLVDERSSLTLPPPRGSYLNGAFFFEEIELPQFTLEVMRIIRQDEKQFVLGCRFVDVPSSILAEIRSKMTIRLNRELSHKSR